MLALAAVRRWRRLALLLFVLLVGLMYYASVLDLDSVSSQRAGSPFSAGEATGELSGRIGVKAGETASAAAAAKPANPGKRKTSSPIDGHCKNTMQGQLYIADDRGRVCNREDVDWGRSECCQETPAFDKHTCKGCADGCCDIYEVCVSCCQKPENKESISGVWDSLGKGTLFKGIKETFDFCALKCRTNGKSVVHENGYIDERKYCYSKLGPVFKPPTSKPAEPAAAPAAPAAPAAGKKPLI
eukprot:tig00001024_g6344.t1